ncbi:vitamin K epoxide reductase family protein [Streptosporangium roseum]|uniref:Membrane protein-like protein n=1 Tax=Streptosporangium roseum (strain ATCC 12428 / DSM 43021 / JCM 3005 / KCTC 9067 / NCIMB 10171 / NRRL 2505 / NI 9100) TaxID=479432 RepID=D2B8G8_STRRD|nr:vitamin K epoxide reductase family protein [Streptosporangium roseum]ACZ87778.1 membrane protein-like protein [Streptosporangium roseum DSM 43021]
MTTVKAHRPGAAAEADATQPIVTRSLPFVLAIGGSLGVLAAFLLMVERLRLAADPGYVPTCSINPILSCGSVMKTEQASVFGFPNPLIGIAAFSVVTTVGTALLAGARFRKWFWYGLQLGTVAGVVFVHWLIFQSLYRIGALCPYCMVVWAVTIPIFWYVTLANLEAGRIPLPGGARRAAFWAARYHTVVLTLWMLAIVGLILQRFWYYWITLV